MTPRYVEKLQAIGYDIIPPTASIHGFAYRGPMDREDFDGWGAALKMSEERAWMNCKLNAESPKGMKATMADKVRWLIEHGPLWSNVEVDTEFGGDGPTGWFVARQMAYENGETRIVETANGASVEAAMDALFWKVP